MMDTARAFLNTILSLSARRVWIEIAESAVE